MISAIGCSSVATEGGEGGVGRGVHRGSDGERVGNSGLGGAKARLGVGAIGESTVGVSSTSKNRPSQHKYKYSKQFELKQSWKALRALNARWALPVYPVFEDLKRQTKNRSSEKSHKTDRTNIIATNFVWEQLIRIRDGN